MGGRGGIRRQLEGWAGKENGRVEGGGKAK